MITEQEEPRAHTGQHRSFTRDRLQEKWDALDGKKALLQSWMQSPLYAQEKDYIEYLAIRVEQAEIRWRNGL